MTFLRSVGRPTLLLLVDAFEDIERLAPGCKWESMEGKTDGGQVAPDYFAARLRELATEIKAELEDYQDVLAISTAVYAKE